MSDQQNTQASDTGNAVETKEEKYLTLKDAEVLFNRVVSTHMKRLKGESAPKVEATSENEEVKTEDPAAVMAAKLRKIERDHEKLKSQLAEEKVSSARKGAFAETQSLLSGKVLPESVSTVMRLIKDQIVVAEDGSSAFQIGDEAMPLADGISAFLASEEAKFFKPLPQKPQFRTNPIGIPKGNVSSKGLNDDTAGIALLNIFPK